MPKSPFRPALCILEGSLGFILLSPVAAFSQPGGSAPARTLSVSGQGEVKVAPDEATLTAGVVSQSVTADAALAANRRAMNAVFAALKREGIPDKSIQTSEFSVSPQYVSARNGAARRISGYEVSNDVSVTVDDLSKLGPAIDALVASGANSMSSIAFAIRDPKPLLALARAAAIRDAMARAQTYANAAGVTLGQVESITEGGVPESEPSNLAVSLMNKAATPIAAGEESVSAQATMTFEIK